MRLISNWLKCFRVIREINRFFSIPLFICIQDTIDIENIHRHNDVQMSPKQKETCKCWFDSIWFANYYKKVKINTLRWIILPTNGSQLYLHDIPIANQPSREIIIRICHPWFLCFCDTIHININNVHVSIILFVSVLFIVLRFSMKLFQAFKSHRKSRCMKIYLWFAHFVQFQYEPAPVNTPGSF